MILSAIRLPAPTGSAAGAGSDAPSRPSTSATVLPRSRATSSGRRRDCRPATVAAVRLIGLVVPSDLVRMSRTPASSRTARTQPPAMTPVPGEAGFSSTRPAPERPITWWVMVLPCLATRKRFFFASSTAFWMASGTSLAFPKPTPTVSTSLPTTTSAEKEKRRPPFTTLATRLIWTTRSLRSMPSGLIFGPRLVATVLLRP